MDALSDTFNSSSCDDAFIFRTSTRAAFSSVAANLSGNERDIILAVTQEINQCNRPRMNADFSFEEVKKSVKRIAEWPSLRRIKS